MEAAGVEAPNVSTPRYAARVIPLRSHAASAAESPGVADPVTDAVTDATAKALDAAASTWRATQDRRVLRRSLLGILAELEDA